MVERGHNQILFCWYMTESCPEWPGVLYVVIRLHRVSNFDRHSCLCLQSAGVKGTCLHTWLLFSFLGWDLKCPQSGLLSSKCLRMTLNSQSFCFHSHRQRLHVLAVVSGPVVKVWPMERSTKEKTFLQAQRKGVGLSLLGSDTMIYAENSVKIHTHTN